MTEISESHGSTPLDERRFSALWRALVKGAIAKRELDEVVGEARKLSGASENDVLKCIEGGALTGSIGREGIDNLLQYANANDGGSTAAPMAGDETADGTILAGYYEGKPLYTTPADAPLTYTFNGAAEHARRLNAQKYLGHDDWRVPTTDELNVLFENRAKGKLKGTFNETGVSPGGWYMSSTPFDDRVWVQRFSDGFDDDIGWRCDATLRCVR